MQAEYALYTDGSKTKDRVRAGVGFITKHAYTQNLKHSLHLSMVKIAAKEEDIIKKQFDVYL